MDDQTSDRHEPTDLPEQAEVDRLRGRVAALENELAATSRQRSPGGRPARARWRTITSTLLIVIGCLLAPLAVVAVWASQQISDTDSYVQTVAPLADSPAVQEAVTDAITDEIFTYVDVDALTRQAVDALSTQGLPPAVGDQLRGFSVPLASAIQSFTHSQISKIVASPEFATAWDQANRVAHQQLVALLSGEQGGALSAQNGTVSLNLGPFIAQAKSRLVEQGFTVANNIPEVDKSFVLVESDQVTKLQSGYRLLNNLGTWLPFVALAFIGVGVYVAKSHRRALVGAGLGVAVSMLLLGVALTVARVLYLDAIPGDVLPRDAASEVYDTLIAFLRNGLRATLLAFLILAAGAFFTGSSVTATRTRAWLTHGIGRLRGGAESAGLRTGPVGGWVYEHRRWLRIGSVVAGMLALTFWPNPTVAVVIGTAVAVLLLVAVVEFLGRPPTTEALPGHEVPGAQPVVGAQGSAGIPQQAGPTSDVPAQSAARSQTKP